MVRGPRRDTRRSSHERPWLLTNEAPSLLILLLLTTTTIIVIHPRGFQVLEKLAIEHQRQVAQPGEQQIRCSNWWIGCTGIS